MVSMRNKKIITKYSLLSRALSYCEKRQNGRYASSVSILTHLNIVTRGFWQWLSNCTYRLEIKKPFS